MAFLNIFSRLVGIPRLGGGKKKKSPWLSQGDKLGLAKEKKEKKIEIEKKEEKPIEKKELTKHKKGAIIYGIVKEPHISEKATDLGAINRYVFKVFPRANKNEIKKTIESFYGVDVLTVNIVTIPAKKRRLGKTMGFKRGYKKAIVKIKEGQKIEII